MKLYKKIPLLEVVKEGPVNSMVRYLDGKGKLFIIPTKELKETFEEVEQDLSKKSGYKLEY